MAALIGVKGINAYKAKTELQKARIKQRASDYVKQKVVAVLRDLVLNTPQYTGDTAASWTVKTSSFSVLTGHTPLKEAYWDTAPWYREMPKFKGDKEAYRIALAVNDSIISRLQWNSTISIVNTSPTAGKLASGSIPETKLRPGNYIPGDVLAVKYVIAKHKFGAGI